MSTHTKEVLIALKEKNIYPEWVQVGNEIPNGMLWPEGKIENFDKLSKLLNSGYDAVKDVLPSSRKNNTFRPR